MTAAAPVKFALSFPQGDMLFMTNGGIYFQPEGAGDAFMVWGERKELFGKNAVMVSKNRETGGGDYSLVYEFAESGALSDARLVTKTETFRGTLADGAKLAAVNDAIAAGSFRLYSTRDTALAKIFNVAAFPDGRLLIQMFNENTLYLGKPGAYEKLDAQLQAQGGNSMYYKTAAGDSIELPYSFGGPGRNDVPKFNEEVLTYLNVEGRQDPEKFGLDLSGGIRHLDPFTPAKPAAPKAPGL